jgi:hypothetical protein
VTTARPEACVFVIWATARHAADSIIADAAGRFRLAAVFEVVWPGPHFARNLTRLYGASLPQGSKKERQVGTGPFLLLVAVDERPRYGVRRTSRGFRRLNVNAYRAKRRYRRWAGGSFAVHGSLDSHEAERDLRLLLGTGGGEWQDRDWDGSIPTLVQERPVWPHAEALAAAIAAATPVVGVESLPDALVLVVEDVWWAVLIAGGDPPAEAAEEADLVLTLDGASRAVRIRRSRPPGQE